MTLHLWMHWFWVTTQIIASLMSPTTETNTSRLHSLINVSSPETISISEHNYRIAKAIGTESLRNLKKVTTTDSSQVLKSDRMSTTGFSLLEKPSIKENKMTWIQSFSKPSKIKYNEKISSQVATDVTMHDFMTVMPLHGVLEDSNIIQKDQQQSSQNHSMDQTTSGSQTIDSIDVSTSSAIFDSDSMRLGRARGTFTNEFQQKLLSDKEQITMTKDKRFEETVESNLNIKEIATITGSCLAIIIILSTIGSFSFIIYRRKYLNPPQTLNCDKCSNPDSSGYIDDSTIRDNSEEMYSLDNDSFLNSLEAMTIQNYWTDSVKHTKL